MCTVPVGEGDSEREGVVLPGVAPCAGDGGFKGEESMDMSIMSAKRPPPFEISLWMPAVRKDAAHFEPIPNKPTFVKCLPCSTDARSVEFLTSSITGHRNSNKHQTALTTLPILAPPIAHPVVDVPDPIPAVMTRAERYEDIRDNYDEEMPHPSTFGQQIEIQNPFEGTISYGGEILDAEGNPILFSAGEMPVDKFDANGMWKAIDNLDYHDHTIFADMTPMMADLFDKGEDCTVSDAVRAMAAMGIDDSDEEEDEESSSAEFDHDFAPHGSKTMFMLDQLDNNPRLWLSDDHMKAIIWTMKESGTPNVPSFYAFRKMQKRLAQEFGLNPRHHTSSLDNQFHMNHPNDLLRLDFANPLVREYLHFYPEITTTISESWQAAKWVNEIEDDDLSPMWSDWEGASHRHFYVKELAQCGDEKYCVPLRWFVFNKRIHCDAYLVTRELLRTYTTTFWTCNSKEKSGFQGKPVFVLRIMPWADDVSGNRSKQYNAHKNIYLANLNLPHKLLSQEYFVRFCATSQHASSLEQFDALAGDCTQADWTTAYDCKLQQEVFRIGIHLLPADNPQQAETTSTAGSSANLWCREGDGGGSAVHRETNEGYHALFSPGKPRTPEDTVAKIKKQIKVACLGVAEDVKDLQTDTGVKDKTAVHWMTLDPRLNDTKIKGPAQQTIKDSILTQIQEELYAWVIMQPPEHYEKLSDEASESPLPKIKQILLTLNLEADPDLRPGDHYNILLRLRGLDPHRDSPCEILHTILLGEDKYVWHETTKLWSTEQGALFAARLQSASIDGLNLTSLRSRYMVQYKQSLIGKHFKALQQLSIFQLDSKLCSGPLFELWKANGLLGALLWFPEIKNADQYQRSIALGPHRSMQLKSSSAGIPFFDSAAPSLDIATTLADMERFKHQVNGGWWKSANGDWTQAGCKIRRFLTENKQLQRRLGWTADHLFKPGTVKILSKTKRRSEDWKTALGSVWDMSLVEPLEHQGTNWHGCKYVVARSEDPCFPQSWVFFSDGARVVAGQISKILVPVSNQSATEVVVAVQEFTIPDAPDARFDMPLKRRNNNYLIVWASAPIDDFQRAQDNESYQLA
ncbi:hypothetical protein B0H16DRAFT_1477673 [Mycena metata]|uniref:Uncharacterized protein n=1 Tax=Mycena metata TaxID=1033252 RepID=A0AAD7H8J1_9AGAR|nr:hypothetical protein B0H16DRAFT_1477673 [Mycena metata]